MRKHKNDGAIELGMISDNLDWFTLGSNLQDLNRETLKKAADFGGITVSELSRKLKFPRTNFYNAKIKIDKKVKYHMLHVALISNEILYLYADDKEKALKWVLAPNDLFFGRSPFEMALSGKGKIVLNKLYDMSGKNR